jgi:hypothetical protein
LRLRRIGVAAPDFAPKTGVSEASYWDPVLNRKQIDKVRPIPDDLLIREYPR